MQSLHDEEKLLADRLKNLCDDKGKEINVEETTPILHQLGLVHIRKDDKINLIRGAGLLNAALFRQPLNLEIKSDLESLCLDILKQAHAEKANANLLTLSLEVRKKFEEIRKETKKAIQGFVKIPYGITMEESYKLEKQKIADIQFLQSKVTAKYIEIMNFLSNKCIEVMGKPPCKFALVGVGSLARSEITLYSDFESVIVLEESKERSTMLESTLEYFRWYSVLFQIVLVNLRETLLRFLAIPCLNDQSKPDGDWYYDGYTPCGVCPDGFAAHACKNPLGRLEPTALKPWKTELIQPISEMVNYLEREEDLKNGYYLGDLLTKMCFVSGDIEVYNIFAGKVKEKLKEDRNLNYYQIVKQLKDNLKDFDSFQNLYGLQAVSSCDIKRVMYRSSSLFISALGRLFSIDKYSCFNIVKELYQRKVINLEAAHHLSYAVALSCQVRVNVYMCKHSQDDILGKDLHYDIDDSNVANSIAEIIGEKSVIDYFVITDRLQNAIRNEDFLRNLNQNLKIKPYTKFLTLYYLNFHDRLLIEWEQYLLQEPKESSLENGLWIRWCVAETFHRKGQYDEALTMFEWFDHQEIHNPGLKGEVKITVRLCLLEMGRFNNALEHAKEVQHQLENLDTTAGVKSDQLRRFIGIKADCQFMLHNYREALTSFKEALAYFDHPDVPFRELRKVGCLSKIGWCLLHLGDFDQAIVSIKRALETGKQQKTPVAILCRCYWLLGCCYFKQKLYKTALEYLQRELQLRAQYVPKDKLHSDERMKRDRLAIKRMPINVNKHL